MPEPILKLAGNIAGYGGLLYLEDMAKSEDPEKASRAKILLDQKKAIRITLPLVKASREERPNARLRFACDGACRLAGKSIDSPSSRTPQLTNPWV